MDHTNSYEVQRRPHGIAVFGSVPIGDLTALVKRWTKDAGYRFLRPDISDFLGAAFVIVQSDKEAIAWLQELGIRPDHPDWLKSGDTGLSSKTIFGVLAGRPDVLSSIPLSPPADQSGRIGWVKWRPSVRGSRPSSPSGRLSRHSLPPAIMRR